MVEGVSNYASERGLLARAIASKQAEERTAWGRGASPLVPSLPSSLSLVPLLPSFFHSHDFVTDARQVGYQERDC